VHISTEYKIRFEETYVSYYERMKRFAQQYVIREEDAENIVHDIFADLWEHWTLFSSHNNLLAFLFLAVKNKCIDFLRKKTTSQQVEDKLQEEYLLTLRANLASLDNFDEELSSEERIQSLIKKAVDSLPDKCREIFLMNKIEGKKQKEIAKELNISIKTVEAQMGIAYKKLRTELKDFLPLFFFIFY